MPAFHSITRALRAPRKLKQPDAWAVWAQRPNTSFAVVVDSRIDGLNMRGDPVSRQINRVGVLKRVLKRIRRNTPKAYPQANCGL